MVPTVFVLCMYAETTPAPKSLYAFFSAAIVPFLRNNSRALSKSPPASSKDFLHCPIDKPVSALSERQKKPYYFFLVFDIISRIYFTVLVLLQLAMIG